MALLSTRNGTRSGTRNGVRTAGETFDFYVDAVSGSNANPGTKALPWQTLTYARTTAPAGTSIGLRRGQLHYFVAPLTVTQDLGAYGPIADGYATLDARLSLVGNTWTDEGGGIWKTSVTLEDSTVAGGTTSNTTYFGVWLGDLFGEWMVGGADIAANLTALGALASDKLGFAINRTGSTTQDIRSDSASTGPFELYVRLPDSADPNGSAVGCTHRRDVGGYANRTLRGLDFIGAFGKDSTGIEDYTATSSFENCRFRDMGSHGWVGPGNFKNHVARGQARKGMGNFATNREGNGVNLFTTLYAPTKDLIIDGIDVADCNNIIYGHGSGNQGYRRLYIKGNLKGRNVNWAVRFDPVGAGALAFFAGGVQCDAVVDVVSTNVFSCEGAWDILGGGAVTLTPVAGGISTLFAGMTGAGAYLRVKNVTVTCTANNTFSFKNFLCNRSVSSALAAPTLELDGFVDASTVAARLQWVRGASPTNIEQTHLILKGNTQLWDLADQAGRVNFPASLTVEAGCRFGWGNRTRDQLRTALDAAGVTHDISDDTTIVGIDGTVLSAPA